MVNIVVVGIGGFLGAVLRYLSGAVIQKNIGITFIPVGTLFVNVAGCFFIGFLFPYLTLKTGWSQYVRLLLITGFVGGFTTFSTLSFETLTLVKSSSHFFAGINMFLNIMLGFSALWLGEKSYSLFQ